MHLWYPFFDLPSKNFMTFHSYLFGLQRLIVFYHVTDIGVQVKSSLLYLNTSSLEQFSNDCRR